MADNRAVKVGDKVRSLVTEVHVRAGADYEVTAAFCDGDIVVRDDEGDEWMLSSDEFTLPVAPPDAAANSKDGKSGAVDPAFKVGDRVRVLREYLPWANAGEIGIVQQVDAHDRDCYVRFDTPRAGDDCWYVKWYNLEIAAPLTIREGAYYRTRDGRKVGPMRTSGESGHFYWRSDSGQLGNYDVAWAKDGRFYENKEHKNDLIAEWPDESGASAGYMEAIAEATGAQSVITIKIAADTSGFEACLDGIIGKLERIRELKSELAI